MKILFLSPLESNAIKQRPHHFAEHLSKYYSVTYVNPVGLRNINLKDLKRLFSSIIKPKTIKSKKPKETINSIDFFYLPFPTFSLVRKLNYLLFSLQFFILKLDFDIVWLSTPSMLSNFLLLKYSHKFFVYDCMDKYELMHTNKVRLYIKKIENQICNKANIVFCSSQALKEYIFSEYNIKAFLIRNGVEVDHFINQKNPNSSLLKTKNPPIIGFYGTIGDWVDLEIFELIADSYPNFKIHIIGPIAPNVIKKFNTILSKPNVSFFGQIDYQELPKHASQFDIAILPFKKNELTIAVNPVKMYEYMALAKPIIATDIPEITKHNDIIYLSTNKNDFISTINFILNNPEDVNLRRNLGLKIVNNNSWEKRVNEIEEIINKFTN